MPLDNKAFLIFFVIIPILLIFSIIGFHIKKKRLKQFANFNILKELLPNDFFMRQHLKLFLKLLAILFIIIALAGPRFGKKNVEIKRKGLDIIIAIDTSNSMLAEDIKPNRMSIAKLELSKLVSALSLNKIGIIAFAGESILQCPLTLDFNAVKLFLDFIEVGTVPEQGTDISKVINLALNTFDKKERAYKILLILTDGEDHSGNVFKLAQEANRQGIKIFTIGIGNKSGEIIPIREKSGKLIDYKKDSFGNTVTSKLDEELLKNISKITDGKYYYSKTGILDTDEIVKDLDSFEKKSLSSKMSQQYEHRFYYFIFIAIIIFIIELFIKEVKNE